MVYIIGSLLSICPLVRTMDTVDANEYEYLLCSKVPYLAHPRINRFNCNCKVKKLPPRKYCCYLYSFPPGLLCYPVQFASAIQTGAPSVLVHPLCTLGCVSPVLSSGTLGSQPLSLL